MIRHLFGAQKVIRIKKKLALARSCAFLLVLGFIACGGGGGGGSSSGGGGGDSSSGVRVLHAAVDGLPVDVISSARSGAVTSKVVFADRKSYRNLSSGAQSLSLVSALNAGDVMASFDVTSSGDDAYSILLYGSLSGAGLKARLIEDIVPQGFSGAVVRFVHGAAGASAIVVNAASGEGPQQVSFGGTSDYMPVAPGSVQLSASRAADGQRLVSITETLDEGAAYTVLVAGEVGYYAKGILFRDR